MLVVARRQQETIHLSGGIIITVASIRGEVVRIGITAPPTVHILRGELIDAGIDLEEHREEAS